MDASTMSASRATKNGIQRTASTVVDPSSFLTNALPRPLLGRTRCGAGFLYITRVSQTEDVRDVEGPGVRLSANIRCLGPTFLVAAVFGRAPPRRRDK